MWAFDFDSPYLTDGESDFKFQSAYAIQDPFEQATYID